MRISPSQWWWNVLEQSSTAINRTGQESHQYQLQHSISRIMWCRPFTNKRRDDLWCAGDAGTTNVNTLSANRCVQDKGCWRACMHACVCREEKYTPHLMKHIFVSGDYVLSIGRTAATLRRKKQKRACCSMATAVGACFIYLLIHPCWSSPGWRCWLSRRCPLPGRDSPRWWSVYPCRQRDGRGWRKDVGSWSSSSSPGCGAIQGGSSRSNLAPPPASTGARCWASPPGHLFFGLLDVFLYSSSNSRRSSSGSIGYSCARLPG